MDAQQTAFADLNGLLATLGAKDVDEALKKIDQLQAMGQDMRAVSRKLDMLQAATASLVRPGGNWAPATPIKQDPDNKTQEGIATLIMLGLLIPLSLEGGWILWSLWGWFAVPLGLPAIGFWQICGLDLLKSVIMHRSRPTRPAKEVLSEAFGWMVAMPILWALGWGFHHFM